MSENRQNICQILSKKKWVILSVISVLAVAGIAVGLTLHFTAPKNGGETDALPTISTIAKTTTGGIF